jgi:hypothetical protein
MSTYTQEVAPAHDATKRAVQNPLTDLSGLEKFVADNLPAGSVHDEETRAQITQRLLDNEINSEEANEYDGDVDPSDLPNYGPPGTNIINNEKTEHENEPEQPGHNPFDGGSNKPLKSTPPGHPGALDANSVTKNSKLTEEDETRVGGSTGSYASELSLMLGGITMLYVKGGTVKYAN